MLFYVANADTRIVPARGPVLTQADLRKQYDDVQRDLGAAREDALQRRRPEGSAGRRTRRKEFDAIMGPSDAFVERAFQSLWAYLSPDANSSSGP